MYKKAKKEVLKVVNSAKFEVYADLFYELGTRQGKKYIFKPAKMRKKVKLEFKLCQMYKEQQPKGLGEDDEKKEMLREYLKNS